MMDGVAPKDADVCATRCALFAASPGQGRPCRSPVGHDAPMTMDEFDPSYLSDLEVRDGIRIADDGPFSRVTKRVQSVRQYFNHYPPLAYLTLPYRVSSFACLPPSQPPYRRRTLDITLCVR